MSNMSEDTGNANHKIVQNIIIDTNVFNYLSNKYIGETLSAFLGTLLGYGFGLAFSGVSVCEFRNILLMTTF